MLVSLTVNSLCVSGLLFIKNHFVLLLEIRCIESAVLANYKQCVSDFITRAAMFSPPVLHFVILPLSCCSPAFIKVREYPSGGTGQVFTVTMTTKISEQNQKKVVLTQIAMFS